MQRVSASFVAAVLAETESVRATEGAPPSRRLLDLPPTFYALRRVFGASFLRAGGLKFCSDSLQFLPSIVLSQYLMALSGGKAHNLSTKDAKSATAGYAILLFILPVLKTLVEQAYFYRVQCINMSVKAALTTAVYQKSTRLSLAAKTASNSGEVLNLMQLDASRIGELMTYLHVLWSAFLQSVGYLSILYTYLGWATFGGFCMMLCLIPIQAKVFAAIGKRRKVQMQRSDKRVKLENETLSGIKIVKLNGWEQPMLDNIGAVRASELAIAKNLAYLNALVSALITCMPTLVAVAAFTLYSAVMKRPMESWIIFPSLTLFNQLRFPIMFLPRVLSMSADALVSLRRIQRFLALTETATTVPEGVFASDTAAAAKSSAAWGSAPAADVLAELPKGDYHFVPLAEPTDTPFLRDVGLSLRRGSLRVVVGPVGSGKSALASAVLGELWPCTPGCKPRVHGRVAYVAQTAWVQSLTLQQNILFGKPYDAAQYARAIQVACLGPDIDILPAGHDTEIGEKGVTLSGGQKQRVAIARAVYADADVYVLDDPLSALDAHVGRAVFQDCVRGALRDKAVLLITHALHCAAEADQVVVMDHGRIVQQGTFTQLMEEPGSAFAGLMQEHGHLEQEENKEAPDGNAAAPSSKTGSATTPAASGAVGKKAPVEKMIKDEKREEGSVKWSVFASYARAFPGTWFAVGGLLLMQCIKQVASVGTTLWLSAWSGNDLHLSHMQYLVGYAGISLGLAVLTYIKSLVWTYLGIEAAQTLHMRLLRTVLSTRTVFFDVTPLGRILQRFSKDTDVLDNTLPASFNSTVEFVTGLVAVIITMCTIVPPLIPFLLPIGWLYFTYQAYFRASYREIKRLDAVSGSPVYAHFGETLSGLSTVRAFGHTRRFVEDNLARVAANQRAFYTQRCACDRWLPVRLETVGNSIVLVVALLGTTKANSPAAPFVGLVLSFALEITGLLSWVVRQWSELETAVIAVERVKEYTSLPAEEETGAVTRGGAVAPPPGWPSGGAISIQALNMRYQPQMPLVLRDLSVDIAPGQKVGVVGRTGSGKSSLLVALWRLVEPDSGRVLLDGVDTGKLTLRRLRSVLTQIPQDPVLFSGTIRHNLNPTGQAGVNDDTLWRALEAVQLKAVVSASGVGLDAPVAEFGENYSQGQRQLLSLARAMLRNTRVVCLDEATASVDLESDARMQAVIAEEFAQCTVLVIAHRLHTIIESEVVLCMSQGQLEAKGSPHELLSSHDSMLSKLVDELGEGTAASLRHRASQCATSRSGTSLPALTELPSGNDFPVEVCV